MLLAFIEPFRFIKHARERSEAARSAAHAEREAERSHQLAMLESLVKMVESLGDSHVAQAREQGIALTELAKSSQATAGAFTEWLKSFQMVGDPTTTVVREEDEFNEEQLRLAEAYGVSREVAADLPEEFHLAMKLRQGIADIGKTSPI